MAGGGRVAYLATAPAGLQLPGPPPRAVRSDREGPAFPVNYRHFAADSPATHYLHRMSSPTYALAACLLVTLPATLTAQTQASPFDEPTYTGGGDLNPGLHADSAAIERWRDLKYGLSIHWGPSALGGEEISWARGVQIARSTYDSFYLRFDPVEFDAGEWVRLAEEGGMRYVMPTSKHHDGFALWPSAVSPYTIRETPFERDIVRELSDATRAAGLVFGSYYSIIDWYHPDYHPYDHGGPGPLIPAEDGAPDMARYRRYMRVQLRELVEDYGAEIIQLDGEWSDEWSHERGSELYAYLRTLGDSVMVSNRVDVGRLKHEPGEPWRGDVYAGDYEERERMVDWVTDTESAEFAPADIPWQAWVTIDQAQWAYNADGRRLLSADSLLRELIRVVGFGGNYLLNVGPLPDGSIAEDEAAVIREVGAWVRAHGEAIYGTRRGPYGAEGHYVSTLAHDGEVFVFVVDDAMETLVLPANVTGVSAYDGAALDTRRVGDATAVTLPAPDDRGLRVVRVTRP